MKKRIHWTGERLGHVATPINTYCIVATFGMAAVLLCFFFSRGELINHYFFYDTRDTGMDFLNSIEYVNGRSPYELFGTLYPPLANMFFFILYKFVPRGVSGNWPMRSYECVAMRGTNLDSRTYQSTLLMFLFVLIIVAVMMMALLVFLLQRYGSFKASCAAFYLVLCPGMMFSFERGNILFLTVVLTLFFVCFRNSDNKILRELSMIGLAIAAGMKLYPALFGILLIRDKQYKRAIRAVIYGLMSIIIPLFVFREGISGLSQWLAVLFRFGTKNTTPWIGLGFSSILHRIALYLKVYLHIEISTGWFKFAGYTVAILLLLSSLTMKEEWKSVLTITWAMVMFQPQGNYIYSFFCIPMVLCLSTQTKIRKDNVIPFVLLVLCTIHLPLFYTKDQHYPDIVFYQFISVLAVTWCLVNAVSGQLNEGKRKNEALEQ